jgi:hypothetical protein
MLSTLRGGLLGLIVASTLTGCSQNHDLKHHYQLGDYKLDIAAYEYILQEEQRLEESFDEKEIKIFCEEHSGTNQHLTVTEAKEGIKKEIEKLAAAEYILD